MSDPQIDTQAILAARPAKNRLDVNRPYAFLVEPECGPNGLVEDVATIFLTNRECPFRCLMCDLWRNTTDDTVPNGAIPRQIDFALSRLSAAKHVKLYNSGNFFDPRAIPRTDYPAIIERVEHFETVIVENHPRFCDDECLRFRDALGTDLEIAIGLETVHPEVLPRLNKQMTTADFTNAVRLLTVHSIHVRAFLLLKPPFLSEDEGVEWTQRSLEFAFDAGVRCCAVIPTRSGNGVMERLETVGDFSPPSIASLETVLEHALRAHFPGRVFVDLWNVEQLFTCGECGPKRAERLRRMNYTQSVLPPVLCDCRN
ncbi:MAG: radical SAM protein [Planctomycetes bacterium]|nr:radical SAM protein [Planctomycetota bacterium]